VVVQCQDGVGKKGGGPEQCGRKPDVEFTESQDFHENAFAKITAINLHSITVLIACESGRLKRRHEAE
jgi:hypothetical protein